MKQPKGLVGQQAVVIGASMGGLLAARVLANHFEQVTLMYEHLTQTAVPPA